MRERPEITITPKSAMVRDATEEYCRTYLNPGRRPFIVNPLHHLQSWWGTPEASRPGCYAIYSTKDELLYIGVATNAVGNRLAAHVPNPVPPWAEAHRLFGSLYIQIINVNEAFEAPSLEAFLIRKFNPKGNISGNKPLGELAT